MKSMLYKLLWSGLLSLSLSLFGCTNLRKDNEPKDPPNNPELEEKFERYKTLSKSVLDRYGLVAVEGIGDSALTSCLHRAAGATKFDVSVLFTVLGKPLRHPDISRAVSKTPISKDMVNGIMWCLYTHEDKSIARDLIVKMIKYGRANKIPTGQWSFCSDKDRQDYQISDEDYYGRCVMTPALSKDVFRLAIHLGWTCDESCKLTMATSPNVPVDGTGYERHLAFLTTSRNGFIEAGINDNSKDMLKAGASDQPRNALFQAIHSTFTNGDQSKAWEGLLDESIFPKDHLPTMEEHYCTDYLFSRDERHEDEFTADGAGCIEYYDVDTKALTKSCERTPGELYKLRVYNDDWLPCTDGHGPKAGTDFLFAAAIALGKIR